MYRYHYSKDAYMKDYYENNTLWERLRADARTIPTACAIGGILLIPIGILVACKIKKSHVKA